MTATPEALYTHIRRLLDEHVAVHLTTYYVDCTQLRVYKALTDGLLPVPVDDPHALVLPSDPLDDFIQEHCQIKPNDMHERLGAVKMSLELIHCTVKATSVEKTFASKFPDTFCGYSQITNCFADPSVLAVRSIRDTPKPGCSKTPCFVPLNLREVLSQNPMDSGAEDGYEDIDPQAKDVVQSRIAVGGHSLKEILSSYQASPFSTTHISETASALCNLFLRRVPSPPLLAPLPQTPPLFPRLDVAPRQLAYVPTSMSDLPLVAPLSSGDGNEGTPEYAAVDDEWAASSTLSPPTPPLNDGTNEQDKIFVPSSESNGPIDDLLAANMEFHVPRQLRVGGFRGALKVPGEGRPLHEYVYRVLGRGSNVITTPSSASHAIGSPAHRADAFPIPNNMCRSSDDLEAMVIGPLSLDFADEAIDTVLLEQSKDSRDGLMDVPQLPAPNVHPRNVVWPSDMSSLVTHKDFSIFYTVKGVKSLNFELTWRPYNSDQEVPTLEELVGVSELHFLANSYVGGEETKAQLAELLKQLDPFIHPISIEQEDKTKPQSYLKYLTNVDFVTDHCSPLDCGALNVLLTRAERSRSRLLPRTRPEKDRDHAERRRNARMHDPEQSRVDNHSEDIYHERSTDYIQSDSVDPGPLVPGQVLPSEFSEGKHSPQISFRQADVAPHAEIDVASAPHMELPMESIASVSLVDMSLYSTLRSLGIPDSSSSDRWSASSGQATCEEQSLRGYLNILAKQPLLARADSDMHLSPPARFEPRRHSTPPLDTKRLLRELSELAAPLPLEVSPRRNHRYLASFELLQDRPLMRTLRLDSLRMELLEREWLDGADIVFDCDTSLVYVPLFHVLHPSSLRSLKDKLCFLSWRYTYLAVVFKLYDVGVSGLQRPQDEEQQEIFSRVIRSIKKLHRDLAIAEAYGTKRQQTIVQLYYVRSIEQAATTTRLLGDMAESRSRLGPWGDRLWLGVDEKEEERYLTGVDGMNAFAAAAVLSQMPLYDFLALRADQRLQLVLPIPEGMIERFNEVIAQRHEDVDTFIEDDDCGHKIHAALSSS